MIRKFLRYYIPHKKLFAADMFCAFLVAVCNMFYPMITRNIINDLIPNRNLQLMAFWFAALLGIYILKYFLNFFIQYQGHVMGVRIQLDIRRDAFDHLQRLPFSFFDKTKTGTIMSRIINDTMEISELAHHGPEDIFISGIMLVGSFVLLCRMNVLLTVIIFAFVPVLLVFAIRKRRKLSEASMRTRVEVGEVNASLENSISGVRVSRAYEYSEHEAEKFRLGSEAYASARSIYYKRMAEFFSGTGLLMDLLMLITIAAGGIFTYYGQITVADFAAYLLFVGLFTEPLKKLINFTEQLQNGITGFARIQELLAEEPEQDSPNAQVLERPKGEIIFENVTFRYHDGKEEGNVLSNLNLTIHAGETVALVGPSGGGKSTLCHLIPRFYELDGGRILLDGVDIRDYTRLSLRRQIGVVQQDTFLFTSTIRDNIAYGNFSATEEEIRQAAKLASIDEYIESLPNGYDTFIGERGVMLSGGQRQRISIARIFLKNPPILILDEATSALDNTTEAQIQQALDQLSIGRTTLVVAHRLSTIRNVDKIVVLTEQGIAEIGTHQELIDKQGIYYSLWNTQQSD
ncbi:MAG: ABC transporter ATP-binding protein [Oscillospiraceae bacterium]